MPFPSIAIICTSTNTERQQQALVLSQDLNLPLVEVTDSNYVYLLEVNDQRLELRCCQENWQPIAVDFLSPQSFYRQHKGGGKDQLIAKAVGIRGNYRPTVIDATAGLGVDGFVLAGLGCTVTLLERSPLIAALLADGLRRLYQEMPDIPLSLITTDAMEFLASLPPESQPDVIYLDPMFPQEGKPALAKKEMRLLRAMVGDDADAGVLLALARRCAKKRVVVKRPRLAPPLDQQSADLVFSGASGRFDVYLIGP